jgi:hypothetical protein
VSEMVPGLHENTRPQRKGRDGHWSDPGDRAFEPRDAPPRWVGLGIGGLLAFLLLSIAAVLWFASANKPRVPLLAQTARTLFQAAGPALEAAPPAERATLERAHPAPSGPALDAAVQAVLQQGWGDAAPPPSRADTAQKRAEVGQ